MRKIAAPSPSAIKNHHLAIECVEAVGEIFKKYGKPFSPDLGGSIAYEVEDYLEALDDPSPGISSSTPGIK